LMLQHRQLFGQGTENGAPSTAGIFQSQLSLKTFFNPWHPRQEALRKYPRLSKRILLKRYGKLRPQGQGRPPGAWSILAGQVAVSKLLEPSFDLRPAVLISSGCGHEFLMNLF
jgi:hypothetical protein